MNVRKPEVAITVSGTTLDMPREFILKQAGKPSFKMGWPQPELIEYWANPGHNYRDLSYRFDAEGLAYQIKGGAPQLDGIDVHAWTLAEIESKLGPADREGRFSNTTPITERHHKSKVKYLSYPEHRLLVRHTEKHGVDFILFRDPSLKPPPSVEP